MFGAATELVITYGEGVKRFALDPALGEFLFVEEMKLPAGGGKKIYSCNEGNMHSWDQPIKDFVKTCKTTGYSARYVGSMVSMCTAHCSTVASFCTQRTKSRRKVNSV